jgi:hypothetical protein
MTIRIQPSVLLVAPLSGHFATRLLGADRCETVRIVFQEYQLARRTPPVHEAPSHAAGRGSLRDVFGQALERPDLQHFILTNQHA